MSPIPEPVGDAIACAATLLSDANALLIGVDSGLRRLRVALPWRNIISSLRLG